MNHEQKLARRILADQGLNLFAILKVANLPVSLTESLPLGQFPVDADLSLILIGNGGPKLWSMMSGQVLDPHDPVDQYSIHCVQAFADHVLGTSRHQLLYPGEQLPPLQQLGLRAGWHHPSPMGIGINRRWGLWFAYRCLILTDAPLPEMISDFGSSPCSQCSEKKCLKACPAAALHSEIGLDLDKCIRYRVTTRSLCADRCLARISCPVAAEQQYSQQQIRYHYTQSLDMLRRYTDKQR